MFNNIAEVQEYINVSSILDIKWLQPYEQSAIDKVAEFIPVDLHDSIQTDDPKIFEEIKRATANYLVPIAIPFLKINWSNIGANNFDDAKLKKADWWDVRDYALSAVRLADKSLSKAIDMLRSSENTYNLQVVTESAKYFNSPAAFDKIYKINGSWDVFKNLQPTIQNVWDIYVSSRLNTCTAETLLDNEKTGDLLRKIIGYYTISDIITESNFLFTTSGIVIQWEELPWQKSQVIEINKLQKLSDKYAKKASDLFEVLLKVLRDNLTDFPCYEYSRPIGRPIIRKKSGLYL